MGQGELAGTKSTGTQCTRLGGLNRGGAGLFSLIPFASQSRTNGRAFPDAEAPAADLDEAPHHVPNLSPGVGEGGYWETGGIQGVVYRAGAKPMGEEGYHPVKEPRSPNCNSHLWPHRDASKQLRSQPSCPDWTHERTPAVKSTRTRGVPGTTAWPPDAMADAGGVP